MTEERIYALRPLEQGGYALYYNGELVAAGSGGTLAAAASRHIRKVLKVGKAGQE